MLSILKKDAISHYKKIIDATEGNDPVTQDLCIQLLGDEEKYLRIFRGYMKGIEKEQMKMVH